jgi:predicted Mrr-cat superfamily restriction endonuclease
VSQSAYILRVAPGGVDKVPEALRAGELIIGWANAKGLLDSSLDWYGFREIVRQAYYDNESNLRRSGAAAGHLWRFIREMKTGDLVVVPYGNEFFVSEVTGPAMYDGTMVEQDSAYRRKVEWLNNGKAIRRQLARSPLISRMKIQGTCADATDLLDEIKECIDLAQNGHMPTFHADLQARLVREVLSEIRCGRIDNAGFERLIESVLMGLGAETVRVVARRLDKGADVLATFRIAGAFQQLLAVQAKHWQPEPPVSSEVVKQLICGIEAESADLGMIITSGSISADAVTAAKSYYDETGVRIEMLDGEQFAKLIVESGIRVM